MEKGNEIERQQKDRTKSVMILLARGQNITFRKKALQAVLLIVNRAKHCKKRSGNLSGEKIFRGFPHGIEKNCLTSTSFVSNLGKSSCLKLNFNKSWIVSFSLKQRSLKLPSSLCSGYGNC